ncbi:unnamed protein product [Haemonchus placei]|uniref:Uncharacterized protein n=1 Tax=Haemonchus placei TaxID=6290 RepID=A0A0N4W792_HAEPC|nr:unnamed protein product [Haemonchus placei]
MPPALRLPLNGIDVKPKLLQSKDYQPPLHRKKPKPPLPPPKSTSWKDADRRREGGRRPSKDEFLFDLFKDAVYSYVIDREVFTDGVINEAVDVAMEQWSDQISWVGCLLQSIDSLNGVSNFQDDLEHLREEIFDELGVVYKYWKQVDHSNLVWFIIFRDQIRQWKVWTFTYVDFHK